MNKPRILVVEDDNSVKNLITTTLKAHDYHFLTAENEPQPGDHAAGSWTSGHRRN